MSGYRDTELALRARLDELDEQLSARERRITTALWRALPAELGARLRRLHAARVAALEERRLAEAAAASEEYLEALDQAVALVPTLAQRLAALPEHHAGLERVRRFERARDLDFYPTVREEFEERWRRVGAWLADADATARLVEEVRGQLVAHFRLGGTPLSLLYQQYANEGLVSDEVSLTTSVPVGFPPLRLRPEFWEHAIPKALGLTRDAEVGDDELDVRFLIDGEEGHVAEVLRGPVRSLLLALCRWDVPRVEVRDGAAVLTLSFEPQPRLLTTAAEFLRALRAVPVEPEREE